MEATIDDPCLLDLVKNVGGEQPFLLESKDSNLNLRGSLWQSAGFEYG